MATLKQIMRDYGPEYVRRFGKTMPDQHRKAIDAIVRCRTEHYGASLFLCSQCGNRHCPNCQGGKTRQWLAKRLTDQLPVNHFLITFTMPEAIRTFIRSHQRQCYGAMFDASSQTMKKLVRNPMMPASFSSMLLLDMRDRVGSQVVLMWPSAK